MSEFELARVESGRASWLGPRQGELIEPVRVTPRQWAILKFIAAYQREEGMSPTLDEIAGAVWLANRGAAGYQVNQLVAKGLISRPARSKRALVLNVKL